MIYELTNFCTLVKEIEHQFLDDVYNYKLTPLKRDWKNLFFVRFVSMLSKKLDDNKDLKVIFNGVTDTDHLKSVYEPEELNSFFKSFLNKMIRLFPNMFIEYAGIYEGTFLQEDLDINLVVKIDRKHKCDNCFTRMMQEFDSRMNKLKESVKIQNFHSI